MDPALKREIDASREALKTLGGEIRLKVHLMNMDAKEAWRAMSASADRMSSEISTSTASALHQAVEQFKTFLHSLERP